MSPERLRNLLERVRAGELGVEDAIGQLEILPFEDIEFARVDHHRKLRQGLPEVIFGEGKTAEQIIAIAERLLAAGQSVLVTRLPADAAPKLVAAIPEVRHNPVARTAVVARNPSPRIEGAPVVVVTAGTSDLPVAEEALVTLECAGIPNERLIDVGVAGLHRLLEAIPRLRRARAVIVVAGMEGALPSVVGGLVAAPIFAVPTSTGYGAALSGLTALLGMLTSCAAGVTVVNIDNGFGAAMAAVRMIQSERVKERA